MAKRKTKGIGAGFFAILGVVGLGWLFLKPEEEEPPQAEKPVANFSFNPAGGEVPVNVNFQFTGSGEIDSYNWQFGDGGSSSFLNPSHIYNDAGMYGITLIVSGPGGMDSVTKSIVITEGEEPPPPPPPPVANFIANPSSGNVPLSVSFVFTGSGAIDSYEWDFGDGSSSIQQSPNHTYSSPGTYSPTLVVTGPGGSSVITKIVVATEVQIPAPVANFSMSPTTGIVPLAVAFSSTSTGQISTYEWDFDDGETSSSKNPNHTFDMPGIYQITLTVTGPGGSSYKTRSIIVEDEPVIPPPVITFTATPQSGEAPLTVKFTSQVSGQVTSFTWDFDDGVTSSQGNPSHTFQNPGTYIVVVTAIGPGGSDSYQRIVTVQAAEPAVLTLTNNLIEEGGIIQFAFSGFQPNSTVYVYVKGGGGANIPSDADGEGGNAFSLGEAPGNYVLAAEDNYGNYAEAAFTIVEGEEPPPPPPEGVQVWAMNDLWELDKNQSMDRTNNFPYHLVTGGMWQNFYNLSNGTLVCQVPNNSRYTNQFTLFRDKCHAAGKKCLTTIWGGGSGINPAGALQSAYQNNREALLQGFVNHYNQYGVDGFCFDCEGQGSLTPSVYYAFIKDLRQRLPNAILTPILTFVSDPARGNGLFSPSLQYSGFGGAVDFGSIMNYDIWVPPSYGDMQQVQYCLNSYMTTGGWPAEKLSLGIPCHRTTGSGTNGYSQAWLSLQYLSDPAVNSQGGYVFNGRNLARDKAAYAASLGVNVWIYNIWMDIPYFSNVSICKGIIEGAGEGADIPGGGGGGGGEEPPPPPPPGSVQFLSHPNNQSEVEVWIDGQNRGMTPLTLQISGQHNVGTWNWVTHGDLITYMELVAGMTLTFDIHGNQIIVEQ